MSLEKELEEEVKNIEKVNTEVVQISAEEQKRLDELEYQLFLASDENKERGLFLAKQIEDIMGRDRWFTLNKFAKKSHLDPKIAYQKLHFVKLFGYLVFKEEKIKERDYWSDVTLFKIVISNESKIKEIDTAIEYYKYQIAELEKKRDKITSQIKV